MCLTKLKQVLKHILWKRRAALKPRRSPQLRTRGGGGKKKCKTVIERVRLSAPSASDQQTEEKRISERSPSCCFYEFIPQIRGHLTGWSCGLQRQRGGAAVAVYMQWDISFEHVLYSFQARQITWLCSVPSPPTRNLAVVPSSTSVKAVILYFIG